MKIAPEGLPFILVALAISLLLWWLNPIAGAASVVLTAWVIAFFRNPDRPGPRGEELLLAPADGKIVSIIDLDEPDVIGGPATRISIFMNVFNVHVNRYPADGTICFRRHSHGRFFNAASEKAALENEQSDVGLDTPRGKILIRQIAGLVARRIVTDHQHGHSAVQGERMGLIRFGSRVDVFVPKGVQVMVSLGQNTSAGQTEMAMWQ